MALLERQNEWGTFSEGKIKETLSVLNSYMGHMRHFRAFRILDDAFADSNLKLYYEFSPEYHMAKLLSSPPGVGGRLREHADFLQGVPAVPIGFEGFEVVLVGVVFPLEGENECVDVDFAVPI